MSLALGISILSALASLTVIATFISARRRASMDEGKRQQIVVQMRSDLDRAQTQIRELEDRISTASGDMRELKTDVKHILAAIQSMESKLDRHLEVQP